MCRATGKMRILDIVKYIIRKAQKSREMITLEMGQVKAFGQLEMWQVDTGNESRNTIRQRD